MGRKRLVLCLLLTVCVISLSALSLTLLKLSGDEFCDVIDECLTQYTENKENTESMDEKLNAVEKSWKKYYKRASFFTRSSLLDESAASIARLRPMLADDSDEFLSELYSISYRVKILYENQCPKLRRVL